jgi:hypothetical protein
MEIIRIPQSTAPAAALPSRVMSLWTIPNLLLVAVLTDESKLRPWQSYCERIAMLETEIVNQPGSYRMTYRADLKAAITYWENFTALSPANMEHIAVEGSKKGAQILIIDGTSARGVPTQETAEWIEARGHKLMLSKQIKTMINILGSSAVVKMGANRWSQTLSAAGVTVYSVASMDDAVLIAKEIVAGKVPQVSHA